MLHDAGVAHDIQNTHTPLRTGRPISVRYCPHHYQSQNAGISPHHQSPRNSHSTYESDLYRCVHSPASHRESRSRLHPEYLLSCSLGRNHICAEWHQSARISSGSCIFPKAQCPLRRCCVGDLVSPFQGQSR